MFNNRQDGAAIEHGESRQSRARLIGLVVVGLVAAAAPAHAFRRLLVGRNSVAPIDAPLQAELFVYRPDVELMPEACDGGADDDGGAACANRVADLVTEVVEPWFSFCPAGARFALLYVTPQKPLVTGAPAILFEELSIDTAPVLWTNYVPDPALGSYCSSPPTYGNPSGGISGAGFSGGCGGGGGGGSSPTPLYTPPTPSALHSEPPTIAWPLDQPDLAAPAPSLPYDVALFSTVDATRAWLDGNDYVYQDGDLQALQAYAALGWTVVAVGVAADRDLSNVRLDSIALTYESSEVRLPAALGAGAPSPRPLRVYVASDTRYDFGAGGTVAYAEDGALVGDSTFLTRNDLDVRGDLGPGADPVAQRMPATVFVPTVIHDVHVPVDTCPPMGASQREPPRSNPAASLVLLAAPLLALLARRRRVARR